MEKRKILFFVNKFTLGGAETLVLNEINLLDKDKYEVYLAVMYRTIKEQNLYKRLNIPDDHVVHFDFKRLFDIQAFLRVCKFFKEEKFDALISNLFESNFVSRIAVFFYKIPAVFVVEHSEYLNKTWWQKIADRILSKNTNTIIAVSSEIADFTAKQEGIKRDKFIVIKQIGDFSIKGIFKREDLRRKLEIPDEVLVSVTVGRFSPEKAQERIIEAADLIVNQKGIKNIYFIIVGYGPKEKELKDLVENKQLKKYVKIINDSDNAREYLVAGDVFVLPSKREGVPLSLLEAMNQGLVPIATDVGGIRGIISPNTGFLLKNGDIAGLVSILLDIVDNKKKVVNMSENVRLIVKEKTGSIKDLENLIDSHLSK